MLELDCGAEFDAAREEECYAALPARPAVFLVELKQGSGPRAEPYLARTADLRRRVERLLRVPAEPSTRLNLCEVAAQIRYRLTGSAFEQSLVYYQHARALFPRRARDLARLRPPALLKLNLANEYPRCYVTRRILSDGGFYYGPFASRRAAETFASEFLNLFKIRRCQIKIRRDPGFPGCIYSEMKMCLAPCFAGCSKPEYDVEVSRVLGFLTSAGASLGGELEAERAAASESTDFERAATVHKKLEKVAQVLRGLPDVARRIEEFDAVVLQPAAEHATIAVFAVRAAIIADPFLLRFGELASQPRSLEEILRESLKPRMNTEEHRLTPENDEKADHLSLLARWFYSKPRTGEMFFPETTRRSAGRPEWPYRRIIRACSRLLAGQQATLPLAEKQEPQMNPSTSLGAGTDKRG
jgi:excinuclease UvrABC nuclease subunit